MSVLINMEMPTSCHVCVAGFGGLCYFGPSGDECECPDNGRPNWCPLIHAADVPPALWTDEPIVGTEFMTHNQGNRGFEIHFRTDSKEKYEAVQAECRRQIGHEKPADVRPVVRGKWGKTSKSLYACSECGNCVVAERIAGMFYCPNCGADMREGR